MDPRAILIPVLDVHEGFRIHDTGIGLHSEPERAVAIVTSVTRPTASVVAVSVREFAPTGTVYASLLCGLDDLIAVDVDYWTATQCPIPAAAVEPTRSRTLHSARPRRTEILHGRDDTPRSKT